MVNIYLPSLFAFFSSRSSSEFSAATRWRISISRLTVSKSIVYFNKNF